MAELYGRVLQLACLVQGPDTEDCVTAQATRGDAATGLLAALGRVAASPLLDSACTSAASVNPSASPSPSLNARPTPGPAVALTQRRERLGAYLIQVGREQGVLPLVAWALGEVDQGSAAAQRGRTAIASLPEHPVAAVAPLPAPAATLGSATTPFPVRELTALREQLGVHDGVDLGRRMAQLALMVRCQQALDRAGITSCVYKGVVLGELCYPRWDLRQAGQDIDLLIAPEHLDGACVILAGLGFRVVRPLPVRSRAFAMTMVGEVMLSDAQGAIIDLHWTLHMPYYRFGPPTAAVLATSRMITISGTALQLRTLSAAESVLLVALHGAKEVWSQWRWLCDLALLLRSTPREEVRAAVALARARGCETLVLGAIMLVEHLSHRDHDAVGYGVLPPFPQPRAAALARRWRVAAHGGVLASHLELYRGSDHLGDRFRGLTAQLRPWPADWQDLDLPRHWSWAYWLYRPWRLLGRTLGWRHEIPMTTPGAPGAPAAPVAPAALSDQPGPPGTPTPHH